ncbi:MAG TPA: hypothetical protein VK835_01130 [Bacteroidia bacterium]|nr:hypothetical protein [Bacteroidia bacterium]
MIAKLKNSTLAFFYRKNEEAKLDEFKKAFSQTWDLTKVEFVPIDKLSEYEKKPNYSYFAPTVFTVSQSDINFVYGLWIDNGDKKRYKIASIPLEEIWGSPAFKAIHSIRGDRTNGSVQEQLMPIYYNEMIYTNLLPGFFKMYLAQLNIYLKKGETKKLYVEVAPDEIEIKGLKEKTLYISKNSIELSGPLRASAYDKDHNYTEETVAAEEKRLFANYPGKIKVVSNQELSDIILNAKEDTYFLEVSRGYGVAATSKGYIAVSNAKTGKIVYGDTRIISNLKPSHFEDLIKKINGDFSK